jgi:hypothetical protein
MSSIRLEIIKENPEIPPCMSRRIPGELNGLITEAAFAEFCDKLDELLVSLDAELTRCKKVFRWGKGAKLFSMASFAMCLLFTSASASVPNFLYSWLVALGALVLYMSVAWFFVGRKCCGKHKFYFELMQEIRSECDAMTRRTPFVSFHVILMPANTVVRETVIPMDVIDCIAVSISASASAVATKNVNNCEILPGSDDHQPSVSAEQPLSSSTDYHQLS